MSDHTVVCRFELIEDGDTTRVRFSATAYFDDPADGGESRAVEVLPGALTATAEGTFEADLDTDRLSKMLGRMKSNTAQRDDLKDVGAQLWTGLLGNDVAKLLDEVRRHWNPKNPFYHIRLALPASLEVYPWEALYDERKVGFLSQASNYCVIHDPPAMIDWPEFEPHKGNPVRILVAIPQGSGLRVGPELRSIEAEVGRVAGGGVKLDPLRGKVSSLTLSQSLRASRCDVVQFVGHGGVDAAGRVQLQFNSDDSTMGTHDLDIEVFSAAFQGRGVRLVLLNSCLGASGYSNTSLSGAGPFLMRNGVPAVIAMRYEIYDEDALRFSSEFYRELVKTGRVDKAIAWARQQVALTSTQDRVQGFVAPVFYLAEGIPRLFRPWAQEEPPPPPPPPPQMPLPKELVAAICSRRCVPVIGPGLLRESVVRNVAVPLPPGPKELADLLKDRFGYPDDADFKLSDAADWFDLALLQRVCQHCLSDPDQSSDVMQAIADAYRSQQPPATLVQIAGWPLPGVVCTYFDGLMWQALSGRSNPPRVFNRVNQSVEVEDQRTVLVNLRGSVTDAKSLMLTEKDNEDLWEDMRSLAPAVSNLVYQDSRTLLFCGVSPRDPAVRRFMQRLMPEGRTRLNGPIFWVVPNRRLADDAYWKARYNVRWIEQPYDKFIDALSAAVFDKAAS